MSRASSGVPVTVTAESKVTWMSTVSPAFSQAPTAPTWPARATADTVGAALSTVTVRLLE